MKNKTILYGSLILILFISIIISSIGLLYTNKGNDSEKIPVVPTVEELNLPEKIDSNITGLFFYDGDTPKNITEDNLPIDNNKPIVIYTHGQVYDVGYDSTMGFSYHRYWQEAGYNAFVFSWGQLADDMDPASIQLKEWSADNVWYAYADENGDRQEEKTDVPQYSVAEIFGSYYMELMTKYDMQCPEVRLMGHSMGGQLTMAASNYLKTMIDKGAIDEKYMLTRITMLDPYLSSLECDTKIEWLDKTFGNSADMALENSRDYMNIGIPVEYIKTGIADVLVDAEVKLLFKETCNFIDVNTAYITGDVFSRTPAMHVAAIDWYCDSIRNYLMDKTTDNINYSLSALTPTVYSMAQKNGVYMMETNPTESTDGDIVYSTKLEKATVAGYAFTDTNTNGLSDDSYASKLSGVEVELYCEGVLVEKKTTGIGGFYKFSLSENYINKDLYIKVNGITLTQKAAGQGYLLFSGNGINANGQSDIFTFTNSKEIKIINIGKI